MRLWGLEKGEGYRTGPDAREQVGIAVDIQIDHFEKRYGDGYRQALRGEHPTGRSPESFYDPAEALAVRMVMDDPSQKRILLSDALASYLKHKGGGKKVEQDNKRYVRVLTDAYGDLPLEAYTRQNVNDLRDRMLADGSKTATVKRYFKSLSAIFTHAIDESDLKGVQNPFIRFKIPKDGQDAKVRPTFTIDELQRIQAQCRALDDCPRHIVAMQSDTGARIGEIIGLRIEDIVLKHAVPHMILREDRELGRSLKTDNSARKVPLVGASLWGVQRAVKLRDGVSKGWLFPQYASDGDIKSTHATNTVNKWIKESLKIPKTSHSFRHSMADRLRHVGTREELIEAIGGWKSYSSMARSYGLGHMLEQLHAELLKVVI